jgi:predicted TIM-barrel fold metal-dependent hydrolase
MITRRQFHQFSLAAAATVAFNSPLRAQTKRIVVDSQIHLWRANIPDRPWSPDGRQPQLPEPMTIERILPIMNEGGVDRAVIVPPSLEGTRIDYGQEAARRYPSRFATMGRINLDDSAEQQRLPRMSSEPAFLGWRLATVSWLTDGTANWFWPAAEKAGHPVMFFPFGQTPKFGPIAERHPQLTLIVDHMGVGPTDVKGGVVATRVAETAALAKYPNVSVKLSSIPLYSAETYPWRDMNDHIKRLYDAFGPQRCHWGSDITSSNSRAAMFSNMKERVTHFTEELKFLSESDKDWIMGKSIVQKLKWA